MCSSVNKTVGIACLSMLLQLGVSAQSASAAGGDQNVTAKSSTPSSSNLSDPNAKLVVVNELVKTAKSEAKADASSPVEIAEPKVSPKNPKLNLSVSPRATRLNEAFPFPELDEMGEPVTFQATAYSLKGRTRLGTSVRRGVIAADPRVLPLGSVVQIKAGQYSGVYTVHDTGKKIKGKIIDVWVPSRGEAMQFGRRNVKINVLRFGHGGRRTKK